MAATLINVFIVPKDKHEEFLAEWKITAEHYRTSGSGLIETHLHRNTDIGNDTFSYVNIARWESGQHWKDSHAEYVPGEYSIPGVKGHPSIFECIVNGYSGVADGVVKDHWIASQPSGEFELRPHGSEETPATEGARR